MILRRNLVVSMLCALIALLLPASAVADAPANTDQVTWLISLDDAYKAAQQSNHPILVYGGAVWCGPCRQLKVEIAKSSVQEKLAGWTCVYIDIDKSPDVAKKFAMSSIPALRALTPMGESAATTEGLMAETELIAWLDSAATAAGGIAPAPEFTGTGAPDGATLVKLVKHLCGNSAAAHESAVRRLSPHPKVAARVVVHVFAEGKLSERLASLELLEQWKAPVDGLDPWRPETITAAKLEELKKWSEKPPATAPAKNN